MQDIADQIDHQVVSVMPASITINSMKKYVDKNVRNVVIISGGFSDSLDFGNKEQDDVANLLR